MITSKRDLKKIIRRIEDEVAMVVIPAAFFTGIYNEEEANNALNELAEQTIKAVNRINISFDKAPDAFDSEAAYKKARKGYFRVAYGKVLSDYEEAINAIIAPINAKTAKK